MNEFLKQFLRIWVRIPASPPNEGQDINLGLLFSLMVRLINDPVIYIYNMYQCKECELEFVKFQDKANHVRWKHIEFTDEKRLNVSLGIRLSITNRLGDYIEDTTICSKPGCTNIISIKYRPKKKKKKYFCCVSCANSRGIRTDEFKKAVSKKIINHWKTGTYNDIDLTSNKQFSSKNERAIIKHFKEKYKDDLWISGGLLKCSGLLISRDMYSKKLKICFEYDGIWHFKNIHNQLELKQKKDNALESWCIENGYRLIRIQDEFFETFDQIEDLIYNKTEQIIKIGNLYEL